MPQFPFAETVWLIAGLGLGILLSMVFLAFMVHADERRLRRRLRPAAATVSVTDRLPQRMEPVSPPRGRPRGGGGRTPGAGPCRRR